MRRSQNAETTTIDCAQNPVNNSHCQSLYMPVLSVWTPYHFFLQVPKPVYNLFFFFKPTLFEHLPQTNHPAVWPLLQHPTFYKPPISSSSSLPPLLAWTVQFREVERLKWPQRCRRAACSSRRMGIPARTWMMMVERKEPVS